MSELLEAQKPSGLPPQEVRLVTDDFRIETQTDDRGLIDIPNLLQQVKSIRKNHPRLGTRKLYEKLQPFMLENNIKIGRDGLFNLLSSNHLLIRKRKRRIQTTYRRRANR